MRVWKPIRRAPRVRKRPTACSNGRAGAGGRSHDPLTPSPRDRHRRGCRGPCRPCRRLDGQPARRRRAGTACRCAWRAARRQNASTSAWHANRGDPLCPGRDFDWFWGDERVVSPDDPRSNGSMAIDALLAHVPASTTQMHLVPTGLEDPAACARAYEASLKRYYGADRLDPARPLFDIMLLGIGPDGHTASLFPGNMRPSRKPRAGSCRPRPDSNLSCRASRSPFPPSRRAEPSCSSSPGRTSAIALARIFAGEDLPAARVAAATSTLWFVDQAALGKS